MLFYVSVINVSEYIDRHSCICVFACVAVHGRLSELVSYGVSVNVCGN